MTIEAAFVVGFFSLVIGAVVGMAAYQQGRASAFGEALENFDRLVGPHGCRCVHELRYRTVVQKKAEGR